MAKQKNCQWFIDDLIHIIDDLIHRMIWFIVFDHGRSWK